MGMRKLKLNAGGVVGASVCIVLVWLVWFRLALNPDFFGPVLGVLPPLLLLPDSSAVSSETLRGYNTRTRARSAIRHR